MAQRRRVSNTPYIYDNTARDLQIRRQMEEPRRQMSHETRKNREKARKRTANAVRPLARHGVNLCPYEHYPNDYRVFLLPFRDCFPFSFPL